MALKLSIVLTITTLAVVTISLSQNESRASVGIVANVGSGHLSHEFMTIVALKESPQNSSISSPVSNFKVKIKDWKNAVVESVSLNVQAILSGVSVSTAVILLRLICRKCCPCIYGNDGKFHLPEGTVAHLTSIIREHMPQSVGTGISTIESVIHEHMPPTMQNILTKLHDIMPHISDAIASSSNAIHTNVSGSANLILAAAASLSESVRYNSPESVNNLIPATSNTIEDSPSNPPFNQTASAAVGNPINTNLPQGVPSHVTFTEDIVLVTTATVNYSPGYVVEMQDYDSFQSDTSLDNYASAIESTL